MESLRMQTRDNLERMVVIQAFIAVRVLGLRQGGVSEETQNDSCEKILTPTEWKLLWVKLEGKPLPVQAPTLKWAWGDGMTANWICPYISRHLLSLNPLQARCRRYSRGER